MREIIKTNRTKDASAIQEAQSRMESLSAEYDRRAWLLKREPPLPPPYDLEATGLYGVAQDNKRYLQELRDKVLQDRIVPFVGPGMSIQLGMPGWLAALNKIYSDSKPNLSESDARKYDIAVEQNAFEDAAQVL